MTDILFKCPACQKALAVDGDVAGAEVECVDCKEKIIVPESQFKFLCSSCKTVLSTIKEFYGHDFTCTECNGKIVVPFPQKPKNSPLSIPTVVIPVTKPKDENGKEEYRKGQMPSIDDATYKRMADNMEKRAGTLKSQKMPLWKKILCYIIGYAAFGAILYFGIGIFVDSQAIKIIIFSTISVILLGMVLKYAVSSSVYD